MGYARLVVAGLLAVALIAPSAGAAQNDPLLDEFSHCSDWFQALDQPGASIVACDQAQLDRFIASGLTDGGKGGARFDGPEGADAGVPAVYSTQDPRGLRAVTITGSGSPTTVFATSFSPSGVRRTTTFPETALPDGVRLHLAWNDSGAGLITADGRTVASAPVQTVHGHRFRMLPQPRGLRARRVGERVEISWTGRPGTVYRLFAGRTYKEALSNVVVFQTAKHRVVVRAPASKRWIGLKALKGESFSQTVRTRVA